QIANNRGFVIKNDVTVGLSYLCCGENAGPKKISKAKTIGAVLMSEKSFLELDLEVEPVSIIDDVQSTETLPIADDSLQKISIYDEHPLLDYLWSATDAGKRISIIYHGGSNPGVVRDIIPRSINENFTLQAVDLNSNSSAVKLFAIENIEVQGLERLLIPDALNPRKNKHEITSDIKFNSIGDVHLALKDTLEGMGWYVATYEKNGLCSRLDVCNFFKNGKPRKSPVVTLYYEPENKTRPYVCKCREISLANTYSNLDHAASIFLTIAYEISLIANDKVDS
ncbi:BRCT domain-containing protein, partial [Salmonella enterica]|nr:BRCT domain-containing protein [Salmonella enterica]EDK0305505.1 BRCT domain-containing protein [Salmonella enterica]EDK8574621.1 BRCT domain-containing protein [Salmonella enterica]EEF4572868.1 BRCT domain-containing protein [Salmonella enterica]EEP7628524.1 BRCT domain-containing protein [Salmonella enterica]